MRKLALLPLLITAISYAQAPSVTPAFSIVAPQSAQQQSSLTYYVDSFAGNDTSAGTSPATAWKTLAKVKATSIPAGAQVLLYSEGVWHEDLTYNSSYRLSWYGTPRQCTLSALLVPTCTHMPIIDGSDVIAGPWSASGAAYARAYTTVASKVYVDALYQQTNSLTLTSWQGTYSSANGTIYIPGQGVTLSSVSYVALQTNGKDGGGNAQGAGSVTPGSNSAVWLPITGNPTTALGMVQALPGYFLADGTNLTVHLLDNTTPTNHVIEAAGSRSYGINLAGTSNVTIDGIEVIRTAKSGIVMYNAGNPTGAGNVIRNNVVFNYSDFLTDTALSGLIGGGIAVFGGYGQSPEPSPTVDGNWVGQMDTPRAYNQYLLSGILVAGTLNAQITSNKVATVNGWAVTPSDYYGAVCTSPYVYGNETANSEGNFHPVGCSSAYYASNYTHDSFGNMFQGGQTNANESTHNGNGLILVNNVARHIRPAYSNGLYNGIDMNYVQNGVAIGNEMSDVASFSMTLENDGNTVPTASSGWTLVGNKLDSSQNVSYNNGVCGTGQRCGPLYMRDLALNNTAAGFMKGNTFVYNPLTPVMAMGGTGAGDTSKDLTEAQFDQAYPNARVNVAGQVSVSNQFIPAGGNPTMVAGAAAGTTPTCATITGVNQTGVLNCTTGTATTTGTLATITFSGTLAVAPKNCQITPRTALTSPAATSVYTTAPSTTTWTVGAASALAASTAYSWSYVCM